MSKFELIQGSCVEQKVDVIVNAANRNLVAGGGVCGAIFEKAGFGQLTAACEEIDTPLNDGDVAITPAFGITNARRIIHAVGPNFAETPDAHDALFNAYYNSLLCLREIYKHSISFPLISSGIFGGRQKNPAGESAKQFGRAYMQFIKDFPDYEVDVKICAFSPRELKSCEEALKELGLRE